MLFVDLVPNRAKTRLRHFVNRLGLEVSGDPYTVRLSRSLKAVGIDLVIDIGANEGQYARGLRAGGYQGSILSVEPLRVPFARLAKAAHTDSRWACLRSAISDSEGTVTINVSGNSVSSSLLTMLPSHSEADPKSAYVSAEVVPSTTVDALVEAHKVTCDRTLLKIDVQGLESQVLDGAAASLPNFAAVQIELSLVPLYEGQALMDLLWARLTAAGFVPWLVEAGFSDPQTGRLLQCDGLFVRSDRAQPSHLPNGGGDLPW